MSIRRLSPRGIHQGTLILVNRKFGYVPQEPEALEAVPDETSPVLLERRAAVLLNSLMARISGWEEIMPVSGWRSQREQQEIWADTLRTRGMAFTGNYVAVPGHSEHQTGLAIDLGLRQEPVDPICPAFPYDGICRSFRTRAAEYGFVCRYPAGKEHITGIAHEPWHFRYVGAPHARIMTKNGWTLEEYITSLRRCPRGKRAMSIRIGGQTAFVSYVKAVPGTDTEVEVDTAYPCQISGNNVDGFIVTEWRRQHA